MCKKTKISAIFLAAVVLTFPSSLAAKKEDKPHKNETAIKRSPAGILWRDPTDIASRNLFYGPGGKEHEPHTTCTFLKEDLDGINPKFEVRDQDGVEWKVKLGLEARPETAATRLVWAVGYFTDEDYFLPELRVEGMPRLKRGQHLVALDGSVHNVRLERHVKGEKKIGTWRWRSNPFTGAREFNGLRVLMSLINNWDLKDANNGTYEAKHDEGSDGPEVIYKVSDLGSSFGTTGHRWTRAKSKGNLQSYSHSKFIDRMALDYVDFSTPALPGWFLFFKNLKAYGRRWIGKNIPREDARWIGQLLSQLSADQIRDAFRAAGYSPEEIDGFARVLLERIGQLNEL